MRAGLRVSLRFPAREPRFCIPLAVCVPAAPDAFAARPRLRKIRQADRIPRQKPWCRRPRSFGTTSMTGTKDGNDDRVGARGGRARGMDGSIPWDGQCGPACGDGPVAGRCRAPAGRLRRTASGPDAGATRTLATRLADGGAAEGGVVDGITFSEKPGDVAIDPVAHSSGASRATGAIEPRHGSTWGGIALSTSLQRGGRALDAGSSRTLAISPASAGSGTLRVRLVSTDVALRDSGCYPVATVRWSRSSGSTPCRSPRSRRSRTAEPTRPPVRPRPRGCRRSR